MLQGELHRRICPDTLLSSQTTGLGFTLTCGWIGLAFLLSVWATHCATTGSH